MNGFESRFERLPKQPFTAPAVESFFDAKQAKATWPEHIVTNLDFQEQTEKQRAVLESYQTIIKSLPLELSINEGLEQNLVNEQTLAKLYTQLAEYIKSDPAHARLVLYFPFELLTSPATETTDPELSTNIAQFTTVYKKAWETQLDFHEVRANFVNGDVLEPELLHNDHPRVVKATHLIPGLVERGLMTVNEVIEYAQSSNDRYVKDGILDACEVMMDKGLIKDVDLELFKNSSDPYLRSSVNLLRTLKMPAEQENNELHSFSDLVNKLEDKLTEIYTYEPEHSTPARTAWLRKDTREKTLHEYGSALSKTIISGEPLPSPHTLTPDTVLACVDAIRQASLHDPATYEHNSTWLETIEQGEQSTELTDSITKLYSHLNAAGIVNTTELSNRNIHVPKLEGPFSENLKLIEPFMNEVKQMTTALENDLYLKENVYPVTLVFGSQLKGYGTKNADADVAVFVRPGVSRNEHNQLEEALAGVFTHEKIEGKAVMFWLDEIDTGLGIHDYPENTTLDGKSSWIHVLFGAAWEGKKESIEELHDRLLTNYFYDPGTQLQHKPTRERWLEEMERDTLQYRLLHKGFERYYPVNSPMDTPHGDAIDGKSAFYDPRYRRIATELYLSRIFLPKLER